MALFKETVPKAIYDQKCAEYRELLEKYHALRQSGHDAPNRLRMIPPKLDSAQQAIAGGERAMVDPRVARAFAQCIAEGMSEPDALREANRLVSIAAGRIDAPSAGASLPDLAAGAG